MVRASSLLRCQEQLGGESPTFHGKMFLGLAILSVLSYDFFI